MNGFSLKQTGRRRHCFPLLFFLALLLFLANATALPAAASTPKNLDRQYDEARSYYRNLLSGKLGKDRKSWLTCAIAFRSIYKAAPEDETAPKSLFMLGKIHHDMYKRSKNPLDISEAIAYYEDVSVLFPKHRLADDALLALGNIYAVEQSDPDKAGRTYAKIIALYPDGDMHAEASEGLQKIKSVPSGAATPSPDENSTPSLRVISPRAAKTAKTEETTTPIGLGETSTDNGMVTVQPIRHWSNSRYTRVIVETSAQASFKHQLLPSDGETPGRLYIDIKNSRLSPGMERSIPIEDGLLRQVRNAQFDPTTVRVVLDTQTPISDYKVFNLSDPSRVVIDVMGTEAKPEKSLSKEEPPSLVRQLGLGIKRIVIDPGHGGKDPGTISPSGLMEKDIVLDVALKLAKRLKENLGCEIILTRNRDVFIPLEERTAIANSKEADLFISIHVNAAPNKQAKGIETYVLDLATNKDAMRVAALENASSARQVSDLQSILMDLMYNSKLNESLKLAEIVQGEMVTGLTRKYNSVNNLGVKKAPFVVLIGAQMPSILTEIAFLSNPEEEKRLKNKHYLSSVADHIASGVGQYVQSMHLAGAYYR